MPKTYTAAGSATAGQVYTASAHNVIVTDVNNFIVPPLVRASRNAALAIPTATDTYVTLNVEDIDTDGCFAATSDTITIQTDGVYQISATAVFASNATGVRALNVLRNATTFDLTKGIASAYTPVAGASLAVVLSCSTCFAMTAGDTLRMAVYQTSGGNLNVGDTNNRTTALSAVWVGKTA
jgi:hypothetical protein